MSDSTAPHNKNSANRFGLLIEKLKGFHQIIRLADEVDHISFQQPIISPGNDHLLASQNGSD